MKEEQIEIKLTEEQQIIELGRLAKECLENESFQAIMEETGKELQADFAKLTPLDRDDFTVLSAKRELFNKILRHFNSFVKSGEDAKAGIKQEAGLI